MHTEVSPIVVVDEELRFQQLTCGTEGTGAVGAAGFAPVTAEDVAPVLDLVIGRVRQGGGVVALLRVDGELTGSAALSLSVSPLRRPWPPCCASRCTPASREPLANDSCMISGERSLPW